jgi:hypothetical protein
MLIHLFSFCKEKKRKEKKRKDSREEGGGGALIGWVIDIIVNNDVRRDRSWVSLSLS